MSFAKKSVYLHPEIKSINNKKYHNMKRLAILFVCAATLVMTSCGMLGAGANNTAAQALGQTCGSAVLGLYNSYKSTGTIDLTNSNNLTNALALATCYTQLRQNKDNNNYRNAFTSGLILSSAGLITNQNVGSFIRAAYQLLHCDHCFLFLLLNRPRGKLDVCSKDRPVSGYSFVYFDLLVRISV